MLTTLVARGLEADWQRRLRELEQAQRELAGRESRRPRALSPADTERLRALGDDLGRVWTAPTTTARDKKELLRAAGGRGDCRRALRSPRPPHPALARGHRDHTRRQRAALQSATDPHRRRQPRAHSSPRPALPRRRHRRHPQSPRPARGERFTAPHVGNLRRYRSIPRCEPPAEHPDGELVTIKKAAAILGVAPSTLHRWLIAGIIVGEQLNPRRAMAHPHHRRVAGALRRRGAQLDDLRRERPAVAPGLLGLAQDEPAGALAPASVVGAEATLTPSGGGRPTRDPPSP